MDIRAFSFEPPFPPLRHGRHAEAHIVGDAPQAEEEVDSPSSSPSLKPLLLRSEKVMFTASRHRR